MKRLRVDETVTDGSCGFSLAVTTGGGGGGGGGPANNSVIYNQSLSNTTTVTAGTVLAYPNVNISTAPTTTADTNIKVISEGMQTGALYTTSVPANYGGIPTALNTAATATTNKVSSMQPLLTAAANAGGGGSHPQQVRSTGPSPPGGAAGVGGGGGGVVVPLQEIREVQNQPPQQQVQAQQSPGSNFQRLKVEDALSYLDLVKFKFGSKPQVYNDFLDIMKEFKSQSIDTPGVIQRVSNLFKGFPELISGFNTFLPPGYKIEVQRSDQGYAFQVSVSMPSPTGSLQSDHSQAPKSAMIMRGSGTINMSGAGGTLGPVITSTHQPQQQPLALGAHIGGGAVLTATPTTVVSQQQQPPPPPPPPTQHAPPPTSMVSSVVHHTSSSFGGGGGGNSNMGGSSGGGGNGGIPSLTTSNFSASLSLSAAQVAVSQALQGHTDSPQNQPVQFNHAINYVNKIKNRFQDQPDKYKKFLDILHIYQKDQRTMKDCTTLAGKHLTEQEVYSQVAKLFENQSDLLAEFGQFLPDATSHISPVVTAPEHSLMLKKSSNKQHFGRDLLIDRHISHKAGHISAQVKRSPPYSTLLRDGPLVKKHKTSSSSSSSCRDVTLAEAGKYGTLHDYAFFDKVRKAVRTQDVYNNFLRCLTLFNQEIISKSELIMVVTPFLGKFPELMRWFREFLGQNDIIEPIPYSMSRSERPQGDLALEIDLTTAKRLGASYCVIPLNQEEMTCSGRTTLCKEVLNDQWVSFPTWSEDSTFVSSRKTQYEEYMYRCEDERFELDVVIETNASTIRVLEGVQKKLNRMSADDAARYRLDDCLGGFSPSLHQRALRRIYGEKAQDIIDGLKRNPAVAVPVVLRRLKAKEEEWREAQKGFNKIWREQNEKYYLKSLDHQGINFKQTDVKALRSKSLFNEIESMLDERHEQQEAGANDVPLGPHLILPYKDRTILDDAANLLIHHVKRQTGIQKSEKRRIKHLLRQFLPELFFHPKQQLTDDEKDDDDDKEDERSRSNSPSSNNSKKKEGSPGKLSPVESEVNEVIVDIKIEPELKEDDDQPMHAQSADPDEVYTLFMGNNNWYVFLRLHAILCERLLKIYERSVILAAEEVQCRNGRKDSTAVALRLKPKPQIEIEDYYVSFLDMVKNLLDGNMDGNTFEDTLREMFGIHAYIAFTLDKVVSYAVRQLQYCVTERTATACTDLYLKEQKRGATGGPCTTALKRAHIELAYQRAAEKAVQDDSCFKVYIYKKDCRVTIELLDTETEENSKKVTDAHSWNVYKERFTNCTTTADGKLRSPVYLNRNLRLYKQLLNSENGRKIGTVEKKQVRKAKLSKKSSNDEENDENIVADDHEKMMMMDDDNNGNNNTKKNCVTAAAVASTTISSSTSTTTTITTTTTTSSSISTAVEDLLDENTTVEATSSSSTGSGGRLPPERIQTDHPGYRVSDEMECKFNAQDSKIIFSLNKDSYFYKLSALAKAKKCHPNVTKRLSSRFRQWLKRWVSVNVSEVQQKVCIDWLMGRGEGVVPNRTRVLTDNDLTRTPYEPFNRYRVERLNETSI